MTCDECQERLPLYLSNELSTPEGNEVRDHLAQCGVCRTELTEEINFARAMHNASLPFRRAAEETQARILTAARGESTRFVRPGPAHRFTFGRWIPVSMGIAALVCLFIVAIKSMRPDDAEFERAASWAIVHYSLVDQTHALRGDARAVRLWFKNHHQIDVVPPERVDYAGLTGCKMTDINAEPAPLLRFEGPHPEAVFILPEHYGKGVDKGGSREVMKDGYRIQIWKEGKAAYLKISKAT